jgi:hypothetical protein
MRPEATRNRDDGRCRGQEIARRVSGLVSGFAPLSSDIPGATMTGSACWQAIADPAAERRIVAGVDIRGHHGAPCNGARSWPNRVAFQDAAESFRVACDRAAGEIEIVVHPYDGPGAGFRLPDRLGGTQV